MTPQLNCKFLSVWNHALHFHVSLKEHKHSRLLIHSFVQQILTEHRPCARHCSKCWSTAAPQQDHQYSCGTSLVLREIDKQVFK